MKIQTPTEFQTYNDGICVIYTVVNKAEAGNMPQKGLQVKFDRVPFERRKLGLTRFYQAMQADVKVEDVIRVPRNRQIQTNDICSKDGRRYRISLAQEVKDTLPPSTDLTLIRLEAEYDTYPVL